MVFRADFFSNAKVWGMNLQYICCDRSACFVAVLWDVTGSFVESMDDKDRAFGCLEEGNYILLEQLCNT